jgi:Tfp pilus assembly protein PilO
MTEERDFRKELNMTLHNDMLDEISRLRAERDAIYQQEQRGVVVIRELKAENDSLRARVKELEESLNQSCAMGKTLCERGLKEQIKSFRVDPPELENRVNDATK